jgi:hypothetical protein
MRKEIKKLFAVTLATAVMVTSVVTNKTIETKASTVETVNHALTATITTSSNESADLAGQYAADNNMNTRWSSSFNNGEWIQLDFGKVVTVGAVQIFWEAAYASEYEIKWSQDGTTWNTAVQRGVSRYTADTVDMFYNRPVRYIRVVSVRRGTQYGTSIYEIKALGDVVVEDETTETTTEETTTEETTTEVVTETTTEAATATTGVMNLASEATATASSVEGTDYTAAKAIDGNMNTRWSSSFNDGEFITLDLGSICTVGSIQIFWEAAYSARYKIDWSQDGTTWNTAVQRGVSHYTADTVDMFYNRPVRYIRITSLQRGTQYGTSIYEIVVSGEKQATTTQNTVETTTEATTAEVTTEVETTTEETTTEAVAPAAPLEVLGASVTTPRANTIAVVWGQDAERINSGCRYNVYVNGVKKLDHVICNYYELTDLGIGTALVVIKSVLNDVESTGSTFTVTVTGEQVTTNVALGASITATNVFGDDVAENLIDGNLDTGWRALQTFPSVTIDLGSERYVKSMEISWFGEYDAPKGFTYFYSNDGENWTLGANIDKMIFQYQDTVSVNVQARYFLVCMGRYANPAHFYGAREIKLLNY